MNMEIKKLEMLTNNQSKKISIASGTVIIDSNKVLLVRGKDGTSYKFPGGYIIDNENLKETAIREAMEEISCKVEILSEPIFYYLNNPDEKLDIILIHYLAKIVEGVPKATTEIEEIRWVEVDNLPHNVMENVTVIINELLKK